MKPIKKTLFFYSLILTFVLFFQGLKQAKTGVDLALIILLSGPTIYFLFSLVSLFKLPFLPKEKLITISSYLKTISFINCFFLFLVSLFGLLFNFEYLFILIILPLPLYFWLADFNQDFISVKKIKREEIEIGEEKSETVPAIKTDQTKNKKINDPLKRQLIKTIGVSGVGLLIAAFLNPKKAEAAFFGSVPGPGTVAIKDSQGNKIDPAVKKPTDGYGISQIDDSSPAYYGYVDKDGNWYIVKEITEVDAVESFRYVKGVDSFSSYWSNRSTLEGYDYFNKIFNV